MNYGSNTKTLGQQPQPKISAMTRGVARLWKRGGGEIIERKLRACGERCVQFAKLVFKGPKDKELIKCYGTISKLKK